MTSSDEFADACVLHNFAHGLCRAGAVATATAGKETARAAVKRAIVAADRAEKSERALTASDARAALQEAQVAARDARTAWEGVCAICTAFDLGDPGRDGHPLWGKPIVDAERAVSRLRATVERAVKHDSEAAARQATAELVERASAAAQRAERAALDAQCAAGRDTNKACASVRDAEAAAVEAVAAWKEAVVTATAKLGLASLAEAEAAMREREGASYRVTPAQQALDKAERFLTGEGPIHYRPGADEQARAAVRRAEEAARHAIADEERAMAAYRHRCAAVWEAPSRDASQDDDWDDD